MNRALFLAATAGTAALLTGCGYQFPADTLAHKVSARFCSSNSELQEIYVCRMPNGKYQCYWGPSPDDRIKVCKIGPPMRRRR